MLALRDDVDGAQHVDRPVTGRLFVQRRGEEQLVDPESRMRPRIDCALCVMPVEKQLLARDGDGGWYVSVKCHGKVEKDLVLWRDLLAGDVLIGPAFHPDIALIRRRLEPRP